MKQDVGIRELFIFIAFDIDGLPGKNMRNTEESRNFTFILMGATVPLPRNWTISGPIPKLLELYFIYAV